MGEAMVRKQVYLAREQDHKLKALATRRGCTEAEIIREAVDRLPDPDGNIQEQLAAAGLLARKPVDAEVPRAAEARALEKEVDAWLAKRAAPVGLSDAVLEDRAGR